MKPREDPLEIFRDIDIYLLDQLLKGRFEPSMKILDAGCGGGRNLRYFMREGYDVYGVDPSPGSIKRVREMAETLAPTTVPTNFRVAHVEDSAFEPGTFDVVICNAVLHFARDRAHFETMLRAMWQLLKKGGIFFCRLASSIGIENQIEPTKSGRYRLGDGSERFLVDLPMLEAYTQELGGTLLEPIKSVNVQGLRCMTTWCLRRGGPEGPPAP